MKGLEERVNTVVDKTKNFSHLCATTPFLGELFLVPGIGCALAYVGTGNSFYGIVATGMSVLGVSQIIYRRSDYAQSLVQEEKRVNNSILSRISPFGIGLFCSGLVFLEEYHSSKNSADKYIAIAELVTGAGFLGHYWVKKEKGVMNERKKNSIA